MKKYIKSFSLATMALSILASGTSVFAEEVVVKVAHNQDFVTIPEAIEGAAEAVNSRYAEEGIDKQIVVEKDLQKIDWNEYYNNINFAHMSGDQPDMMTWSNFQLTENLLPLNELDQTPFVEGSFTNATVDGEVFGMPVSLPVRTIYYNKTHLEKLGWSQEEIDSLPEKVANGEFIFEDYMNLVQEIVDEGIAEWGITHRPGAGYDFLDMYKVFGGEWADDNGSTVFDSESMTRFFTWIYDNVHEREITPSDLTTSSWDTINSMVANGDAFSYYGPMFSTVYVANAGNLSVEEFAEQIDFMLFPVSEWNERPFATAAPDHIAVSASNGDSEVMLDILTELSTDSAHLLAHHSNETFSHSSVIAANDSDDVVNNPILADTTYMTEFAVFSPESNDGGLFREELYNQIQLLELGDTTPEEAVKNMQTQLEVNLNELIVK